LENEDVAKKIGRGIPLMKELILVKN